MTSKKIKIVIYVAAILLILILAAFGAGYILLQNSLPQTEGLTAVSGLKNKVEILYDRMGIPQVWADTEQDLYFAFGYLHASERLFQMELTRRVAQGRLAEILGDTVLAIDIQQRLLGHTRLAQKQFSSIEKKNLELLQAYSDGVNAGVTGLDALPFEFQLLGIDFDRWTPHDCLTLMSFQTWFSNFLMSRDEFFAKMWDSLDSLHIRHLQPVYPAWAPKTVPQKDKNLSLSIILRNTFAGQLFADKQMPFLMSHSSNSWVVAPARSVSGASMLASDPHLDVSRLPQFWYYLGLHLRGTKNEVLGISTPGLPFMAMGHNGKIAWAFTVGGIDVNDYYIEKANQDTTRYLTPEGWKLFEVYDEEIHVSGRDKPLRLRVRVSRHGPLVFRDDSLKALYALRWAGFDADLNAAFAAGFRLPVVDNFEDFRRAVTRFGALDANWTYADAKGNIGYQLGTPIPLRSWKDTNLPVPGWTDEYEWEGYRKLDETPHSYNPSRGWLATCNNKQEEDNLNYPLNGTFAPERIVRISQLLETKKKFSVKDMQTFQMDRSDAYLLHWKEQMIDILQKEGYEDAAKLMKEWQGESNADSRQAALINLFFNLLRKEIFTDEIGREVQWVRMIVVLQLLEKKESPWFDNIKTMDVKETREDIIRIALRKTMKIWQNRPWGAFHTLTMEHPLAVVPVVSGLLGLRQGPYSWGGTPGTLNASFYFPDKDEGHFKSIVGPSWRFVIDFADIDGATMVLPAGNSGNPASKHFMDFFELWRSGKRWNVPFGYEKVKEKSVRQLILIGK